jgi:hypothetical protein
MMRNRSTRCCSHKTCVLCETCDADSRTETKSGEDTGERSSTDLVREDNLNVARAGHVSVDATVSTVRAAASMLGLVDLNVVDVKVLSVERLHLGVALRVGEEILEMPHRLLREAARSMVIMILAEV